MKQYFSIILLILGFIFSVNSFAQRIPLKGVVTVQNSKDRTGKISYVPGTQVDHPSANPDITNDEGRFTLNIVGLPKDIQVKLNVIPSGAFKDYIVVNDLDFTLGRDEPVNIFIRKAGELEQWQQEVISKNLEKEEQKINSL